MTPDPKILNPDRNFFVSGILKDKNYRFVLGRNTAVALETAERHGASMKVAGIMGEIMLGAFFLSTHTGKQIDTTISLHLETTPSLGRIIAFAGSNGSMRAYVSNPDARFGENIGEILDRKLLHVNRWLGQTKRVYQSAVEMRNAPIYKNLEEYIGRSEQIQTFLKLENNLNDNDDGGNVSGYLFQALPEATHDNTDAVLQMLDGVGADEIIDSLMGDSEHRQLTGRHKSLQAHVNHTGQFFFFCDCNRKKIENIILNMGREEAFHILEEHGNIETACEFCKTKYIFDKNDIEILFSTESES